MSSMRRSLFIVAALAACGSIALIQVHATAQERGRKAAARQVLQLQRVKIAPVGAAPDKNDKAGFADSFSFPTDRKAKRTLEAAQDFIKEQAWGEAAKLLQSLLDAKEDLFVEMKQGDKTHWTSIKGEANRLLGTMPPEGRQFYELQFGARAKEKLTEAKRTNNVHLLAEVANAYLHTDAGGEALDLLATYRLDRGSFLDAALLYERLLKHHTAAKLSPLTLLKATLAFRRNGDKARADQVWKRLVSTARGGVSIGQQVVHLDQMQKELDRFQLIQGPASLYDWPLFKGNASRAAEGIGSAPFLERRWFAPLAKEAKTREWIDDAIKRQESLQQPIMPAFFPIAVTVHTDQGARPLLVCRSYAGIVALNLRKEGYLEWDSTIRFGLDDLNQDTGYAAALGNNNNQWLTAYLNYHPYLLYENSTIGTLSTDSKSVYTIGDIALPPHPSTQQMQQLQWGQPAMFGSLEQGIYSNSLKAYDLVTGKLIWEFNGDQDSGKLFAGCYFLGPPLPVGDKLYVLVDKNQEITLVCLEPPKEAHLQPTISWMQTLVNVRTKMLFDVGRRTQAAHLSYSDGILVCPTNAGVILGVDLLSHSLAWAHSYREETPANTPNNGPNRPVPGVPVMPNGMQRFPAPSNQDWKTSAPVIVDGKMVFTAPDSTSVQCVNLRNGDLLWKEPRSDDLYLAGVFHDKVLLVGKNTCRALNLNDGKPAWKAETGMPSGQGVASANIYFLPLKSGALSKEPEVCSLDIDTGIVLARTKSRKKEVPGNLLFYEGDVISQSATQIVAYRQLRIKLEEIDVALRKNPKDPVGLTERGELRLDNGDLAGAASDLRMALVNNPPVDVLPKTQTKLYETLTELLQRDFNANEKYLNEYKRLCQVAIPAGASATERKQMEEEEQRRLGNYFCLLAKGRESQNRLPEAFDAYMEFGSRADNKELISVVDEPTIKARPDVWAQGRIAAMVAKATPEQRKPLEEKIAREWRDVKARNDIGALRRFVGVFGSLFTVGKEARLELAERLIEGKGYLEAELDLMQLRGQPDKALAGQATEALARLATKQGLVEDAAYWYRTLGRDFARTVVRDGKTGADFYNELATDKRLLAYLDEPRVAWASGEMRAREDHGYFPAQPPSYVFEPEGEVLPFFKEHRFSLHNNQSLKITDRATNQDRMSLNMARPINLQIMNNFNMPAGTMPRLPYYPLGHLVVLNVGPMVYGFDPVDRKKLWERDLLGSTTLGTQYFISQNQDGSFQVNYSNNFSQKISRTGPVEASHICLNTREGLVALDPLTGTILWTKTDVPLRTHVFGDDKFVYLVEVRNDGTTANAVALRAHDGVRVEVPDFAPLYQHRLRVVGRNLLLSEKTKSGLTLRYYDVHTGKDHWKRTFATDAVVMQSEDTNLLGIAEPSKDAQITVIDLAKQKDVLSAKLDHPKDIDKVLAIHLLSDADRFYLAIQRPPEQNNPWGNVGPFSSLVNGMRSVPVNGFVYAFSRATRKKEWQSLREIAHQMLVLDQFQDLPIMLFTARTQEQVNINGLNRGFGWVTTTQSLVKRNGKLACDLKSPNQSYQYHALNINQANSTVELIGYNAKIIHYLENNPPTKAASANPSPSAGKRGAAVPVQAVPAVIKRR